MALLSPSQPSSPIRFCYHCGRRVNAGRETCWGCGKPVMRRIHPEQVCPFCRREVPRGAVKCGHCGEWMDGREHQPQAVPAQTVFVVDKTLTGAGEDYGLAGGQRVPLQIAQTLHPQTVRAIEQNRPELIHQPGILALPSPSMLDARGSTLDEDDVIEGTIVQVSAAPGTVAPKSYAPGSRHSIRMITDGRTGQSMAPMSAAGDRSPARGDEFARGLAGRTGLMLGRGIGALARRIFSRRPRAGKFQYNEGIDAPITERTMICDQCSTEVLSADKYCYHCGRQFLASSDKARVRVEYPSNAGLFGVIVVLIAAVLVLRRGWVAEPIPLLDEGLGFFALLMSVGAFFRRRTFFSQFISIVLGVAAIACYFFSGEILGLVGLG